MAIQRDVQISLLDCIRQITQRPESGGSEKNSLCKTIAHVYELDASRGHGWPQFDSCLQELVSQEANWSTRELYYTIAYENPAMFGDAPLPELMGNLRLGLQAISTANLSISPIEAAIAVLQVVDRALQMIDLLPLILDVCLTSSDISHIWPLILILPVPGSSTTSYTRSTGYPRSGSDRFLRDL